VLHRVRRMATRYDALIDAVIRAGAGAPTHPALAGYLDKVRRYAYRVTDEDVAALKAAGLDDDAIFHATHDAALKAGLERWHAGLAALGDEP
jgi:alkylhydroperoxidase family enzyme